MVSLGTDCLRAASTATASRGFITGSGTPTLAAIEISRTSLLKIFPRLAALISRFFWSHWRPIGRERTGPPRRREVGAGRRAPAPRSRVGQRNSQYGGPSLRWTTPWDSIEV